MTPIILFSFVIGYFLLLLGVAWYTSRNADNESFFIGNRNSNWVLVAFGMIGTSLSGVTFVSVPGGVGLKDGNFHYFQLVLGYLLGYIVVAFVLLPLYYRLNLTSIYTYLSQRFGRSAHRTGASYFLLSRTVGATARLYLVVNILQLFILDRLGVPFWLTALIILVLIMLYTIEGGVKTIVFTDTLQTSGMLIGLVVCLIVLLQTMQLDLSSAWSLLGEKGYTTIFNWDIRQPGYFWKQFLGGIFITITMTGLDQEMMQKNISVRTLGASQKNMMTMSSVLVLVNLLFLILGGILYLYAAQHPVMLNGTMATGDDLFPALALSDVFSGSIGVIFIIALISALFPSVDGAITSLTSSFCIDLLGFRESARSETEKKRIRLVVHVSFAVLFFLMVMVFKAINDKSIIQFIIKFAGITYGPLLGLFAFGMLTNRQLSNRWVPWVASLGPLLTLTLDLLSNPAYYESKLHLTFGLDSLSASIFHGYKIGPELILINGLLTCAGLWLISKKKSG
ncbi:MAG: sodium:solute symporter [Bacteroidota bacterium]